jgi:hypothetical protein
MLKRQPSSLYSVGDLATSSTRNTDSSLHVRSRSTSRSSAPLLASQRGPFYTYRTITSSFNSSHSLFTSYPAHQHIPIHDPFQLSPHYFELAWWTMLRRSKRFIFGCICVSILVDSLLYGVVVPVLPKLLRDVGFVGTDDIDQVAGWLYSVYAVGLILANPLFGYLSDRHGNRMVPLHIGGVFLLTAILCFSFATSLSGLMLARFCQGNN